MDEPIMCNPDGECQFCEKEGKKDVKKFLWILSDSIPFSFSQGHFCPQGHLWEERIDLGLDKANDEKSVIKSWLTGWKLPAYELSKLAEVDQRHAIDEGENRQAWSRHFGKCEFCEKEGKKDVKKFLWILFIYPKLHATSGYFCAQGHFWGQELLTKEPTGNAAGNIVEDWKSMPTGDTIEARGDVSGHD